MSEIAPLEGYKELLRDVRTILETTRARVYQVIDNLRVQAYWQVGERIAREELQHRERASYGERLVARLSSDLGFHRRDVYRMLRFYRTYTVVTSLSPQLSWTHYTVFTEIDDPNARRFYEAKTVRQAWSVREVRRQVAGNLYSRSLAEPDHAALAVTALAPVDPADSLRELYSLELPGLPLGFSEAELEAALRRNFERFLDELGPE